MIIGVSAWQINSSFLLARMISKAQKFLLLELKQRFDFPFHLFSKPLSEYCGVKSLFPFSKSTNSAYISIYPVIHNDIMAKLLTIIMSDPMPKIIAVFLLAITPCFSNAQSKLLIAAASDLKFTLDSVIHVFSKTNNGKIDVTYGSSGKLTEQIINGAPFDMFFSADILYPERLKQQKKTSSEIYHYATGRLVIWSKKIDPSKNGMQSLADPVIKKIAIANPLHAPYGKRAVESLKFYKLFESLSTKLVYGENISQTAQFASTGAADIGIVALSLALSPNMKNEGGKYFMIPEESHQPLIQGAAITIHGKDNSLATTFFEFIKSKEAIEIFSHYGFPNADPHE